MADKAKVAKQDNTVKFFKMGEALGAKLAEFDVDYRAKWGEAIGAVKVQADRNALRKGFVTAYMHAFGVTEESAQNRFSYLGRLYSPQSSRKARHNAKVKETRGRKEKTAGKGETLAPQVAVQRLVAVLAFVAKAQEDNKEDDDIMAILGTIARLANGGKDAPKRKGKMIH